MSAVSNDRCNEDSTLQHGRRAAVNGRHSRSPSSCVRAGVETLGSSSSSDAVSPGRRRLEYPRSPAPLSKYLLGTQSQEGDLIPDTHPKGYVAEQEGSFDSACFLARRICKFCATVGRDCAVSVPVNTILNTSAGPDLIHNRAIDPARHFYIRLVQSAGPLHASRPIAKFCGLIQRSVLMG